MNILLKKTSSMASGFAPEALLKQSLTALLSLEASRVSSMHFTCFAADEHDSCKGILPRISEKLDLVSRYRGFHVSAGPMAFRASNLVQAQVALDDFSDDEKMPGKKSGKSEEGLEIAKLGISQEIVDALAKRGIAKLFPIQGIDGIFKMMPWRKQSSTRTSLLHGTLLLAGPLSL